MGVTDKFQQALNLQQAGELESAKRLYKQILQESPLNADAQHNLGLLNVQLGDVSSGLSMLHENLQKHPDQPQYWIGYIHVLIELEDWQKAADALNQARQYGLAGAHLEEFAARIDNKSKVQQPQIQSQVSDQSEVMVLAQTQDEQLLSLYYTNQYAAAESLANAIISSDPAQVLAWQVLGALYAHQEKYDEAERALLSAADLAPNDAGIYSNLGNVFHARKMYEAATTNFLRALELNKDLVDAHFNLGNVYKEQGQFEDAISCYQQALSLRPDFAEALGNLGNAFDSVGRNEEAITCYRQGLAINPKFVEAYHNLGLTFMKLEQFDPAIECFQSAIQLNPEHSKIYFSLGHCLEAVGKYEQARDAFIEACKADPQSYKALSRLGLIYITLQEPLLSLANLSNSIKLNPDLPDAHNYLGTHFERSGYPEMAIESFNKAIAVAPDSSEPYTNLGNVMKDAGNLDEAIINYRKALKNDPKNFIAFSNLLFCVNYHPDLSSEELYAYYPEFEQRFAKALYEEWRPHANNRDPQRRLKIGYVSPSFAYRSCIRFLEPLLAHHDHTQVEVYAYAQLNLPDAATARCQSYADHWIPTRGMTDIALAERIRADGIDILVDVAGHTGDNRLLVFARKPAPVSLHWLDFGYTTGLKAIDYYLTDAPTVPPGAEAYFAEQPWRLPTPAYAYRAAEEMGEVGPLPAQSKGYITFGTLTRAVRLNYRLIRTWAKLLQAVPGSHLIINSNHFKSPAMQQRVTEQFMAHGIARERLEVGHSSPPWDVLRSIDIGLDCFPHNSGTTLFEHLYMGNPIVTLANRPSVGRLGASILHGVGHPEWIAETEEEYIAKAVALAQDMPTLAQLRKQLRTQMQQSPLMDEVGFTRAVEQAYRQMWQQWCAQQQPTVNSTH